jgi:hypothetical protein
VLLRYLSDAYKTIVQNVPAGARSEQLEDIAAYLLTTIKQTDSSLLAEWEAKRDGTYEVTRPGEPAAEGPPRKRDLAKHPKELNARVRSEMHQLVRLLSRKIYDEAAEQFGVESALVIEKWLAPYWAEHGSIDVTPRARQPVLTQLTPGAEDRTWTVRHSLLDAQGEQDWFIEGLVDLRGKEDVDGALVQVRHVGH